VSDFIDDLALITTGAGGAPNVTAACLEREESLVVYFTIRVAKNELFNAREEQYLEGFIIQRQTGFTQSLPSSSPSTELRAIVEGPYGKEIHLDECGTVLLFATGIGIAGQLPYVKQLLENFHNYDAKARRIALFWQVDSEGRP